ncbi:hypothetical protein BD779DRAFT_1513411 [Infundibulicybe gibba]|nr:hypothetical protein BD779DRAFT_1513411 [Infundibulicybe gibba]
MVYSVFLAIPTTLTAPKCMPTSSHIPLCTQPPLKSQIYSEHDQRPHHSRHGRMQRPLISIPTTYPGEQTKNMRAVVLS